MLASSFIIVHCQALRATMRNRRARAVRKSIGIFEVGKTCTIMDGTNLRDQEATYPNEVDG